MEKQNEIPSTLEFRMTSTRFVAEMIFRYAGVWLIVLAAVAVVGIVCGFVIDLRWFVISLMVVFVVFPMLLAFLYYYYALRRETVINSLPHSLSIVPGDGLMVTMRIDEETERKEILSWDTLSRYKVGSNSAIVPLRSPLKGFVWIPASAFSSESEMVTFFKALDECIISQ